VTGREAMTFVVRGEAKAEARPSCRQTGPRCPALPAIAWIVATARPLTAP
jgi:hypothetical protein